MKRGNRRVRMFIATLSDRRRDFKVSLGNKRPHLKKQKQQQKNPNPKSHLLLINMGKF